MTSPDLSINIASDIEFLWSNGLGANARHVFRVANCQGLGESLLFFYPVATSRNANEILKHWALGQNTKSAELNKEYPWLLECKHAVIFSDEPDVKRLTESILRECSDDWVLSNLNGFSECLLLESGNTAAKLNETVCTAQQQMGDAPYLERHLDDILGLGVVTEYAERLDLVLASNLENFPRNDAASLLYDCFKAMKAHGFHHGNLHCGVFGYSPTRGRILLGMDDVRCIAKDIYDGSTTIFGADAPRVRYNYEDLEHLLLKIPDGHFSLSNERFAFARTLGHIINGGEISILGLINGSSPLSQRIDEMRRGLLDERGGLEIDSGRLNMAIEGFVLLLASARNNVSGSCARYVWDAYHLARHSYPESWLKVSFTALDDLHHSMERLKRRPRLLYLAKTLGGNGTLSAFGIGHLVLEARRHFRGRSVFWRVMRARGKHLPEDVMEECVFGMSYTLGSAMQLPPRAPARPEKRKREEAYGHVRRADLFDGHFSLVDETRILMLGTSGDDEVNSVQLQ